MGLGIGILKSYTHEKIAQNARSLFVPRALDPHCAFYFRREFCILRKFSKLHHKFHFRKCNFLQSTWGACVEWTSPPMPTFGWSPDCTTMDFNINIKKTETHKDPGSALPRYWSLNKSNQIKLKLKFTTRKLQQQQQYSSKFVQNSKNSLSITNK